MPSYRRFPSDDEFRRSLPIRLAVKHRVIDEASERQAGLARDARNLIHPGKALRSGQQCNKTMALTALTGVYRVIDALKSVRDRNADIASPNPGRRRTP